MRSAKTLKNTQNKERILKQICFFFSNGVEIERRKYRVNRGDDHNGTVFLPSFKKVTYIERIIKIKELGKKKRGGRKEKKSLDFHEK